MGYTRVTDIIGPKEQPTEMVLQVKISIDDYLALDHIASLNSQKPGDVLREIIHAYVTTTHDPD